MRPGEAGVLPSVDGGAAVARQVREGIDRIERVKIVLIEQRVVA